MLTLAQLEEMEDESQNADFVAVGETDDGETVEVKLDRTTHAIAFKKNGYEIKLAEDAKKVGRPRKETE